MPIRTVVHMSCFVLTTFTLYLSSTVNVPTLTRVPARKKELAFRFSFTGLSRSEWTIIIIITGTLLNGDSDPSF